jgi:hypothetical protein
MMAVSYSASIFGSIMSNNFIEQIKELERNLAAAKQMAIYANDSYSELHDDWIKTQDQLANAKQERDNYMLLHANMELRFCQYILRAENEKAIAARLPHSRGLHPRVAALKGVHTEDGKETKIKS